MPHTPHTPRNLSTPTVITLPQAKIITPAVSATAVTLERIVDIPAAKVVRAFIKELNRPLILWEGDAYDSIGDWTQAQANARVIALIGN
jgi:hypothetical protein